MTIMNKKVSNNWFIYFSKRNCYENDAKTNYE